jgi:hypothetical protein
MEDEYRKEAWAKYVGFLADIQRLETKMAELDIQREDTRKQLERVRRIAAEVGALCGVVGENNLNAMGFTDACRTVLRTSYPAWLSAKELQDKLEQGGFDLSRYESPAASIYTILGRSEGKFLEKKTEGFNTFYRWKKRSMLASRKKRLIEQVRESSEK